MASGDTKTNQYLDIAANGTRADLPSDTCCETRTQSLIRGVAERIIDVEEEVERLENNPDVADIVATYADLQSYDTSQLTDKDVVRVLQDETHDGDSTYYRWSASTNTWTYIGESKQYTDFVGTDGTAAGTAGLVPAPATTDAGKFLKADGTWDTAGGGSSAAVILTADDYNWPVANPDGVALWLLPAGVYVNSGIKVYVDTSVYGTATAAGRMFIVLPGDLNTTIISYGSVAGAAGFFYGARLSVVRASSGAPFYPNDGDAGQQIILRTVDVVDNLTSTYTAAPLSAKQGKVLDDKITALEARVSPLVTTYINLTPTNIGTTTIDVTADKTVAEINTLVANNTPVLFKLVVETQVGSFLAGTYFLQPTFIGSSGVMASAAQYSQSTSFEYRQLTGNTGTVTIASL